MPVTESGPGAGVARPRRPRRFFVALAAIPGILILLFLLRAPILTGFARFLTVDDERLPADAIVLLNGWAEERPAAAARLWAKELAPIVVLVRAEETRASRLGLIPNMTDVSLGLLRHDGVPESAIRQLRTPGGAASTQDEARIFAAYARMHDFDRILVVTSDYHTRRTRRAFRRALQPLGVEVRMAAVPSPEFRPTDWWKNEAGLLAISEEYVKLLRDVLTD